MDQFLQDVTAERTAKRADDINLLNMIESRILEVIQIENECKKKVPKLFSQRLPRFMRRRAACHDSKRLPKKLRQTAQLDFGSKDRKKLFKYRRHIKFTKRKRSLKKHTGNLYKDPNKSLLHKWFAKRFKMSQDTFMPHVPLFNNTKNQRNLQRQLRYGCAFFALGYLQSFQINFKENLGSKEFNEAVNYLSQLTRPESGFTFSARSLKSQNYEVCVHLYKPNSSPEEYLCESLVKIDKPPLGVTSKQVTMTVWIPKRHYLEVFSHLNNILTSGVSKYVSFKRVNPCQAYRVKLIGPNAREETLKIATDIELHKSAIEDVDMRIAPSFGCSIGRCLSEANADFTYYKTRPSSVDIVLRGKVGKMLWYKLVKNKAHLVGGFRDLGRLLTADCFKSDPDCSQ